MEAPYTGPETTTSLQVLRELADSGLPQPATLLGGWAVFFLVQKVWHQSFGEDYFGSRDIDFGFKTSLDTSAEKLRAGNLPATVTFLKEEHHFVPHGMYQLARFHHRETNEILTEEETKRMATHEFYATMVDLIGSHQRDDLREVAGFQAFYEPLLELTFNDALHRVEINLGGAPLMIPAPHVLIGMKLRSLPSRQKDDKSIKDICDLYALVSASDVSPATLRSRLHRTVPGAGDAVKEAVRSPFIPEAARHLDQDQEILHKAISQLE